MTTKNSNKQSVEMDISDFTKDQLIYLIQQSCEQDVSINKIIEQFIEQYLQAYNES